MAKIRHSEIVEVERCPQCGIAHPRLTIRFSYHSAGKHWVLAFCASCDLGMLAVSDPRDENTITGSIDGIYPSTQPIAEELPEHARNYLSQAMNSAHAPDGSVMLAGAAVDAMLKDKGLVDGSVYDRIDQAVETNILTEDLGDWAHEVRLGSNRPRHADDAHPHVTVQEAQQAIEYTRMLGHILYVLPARVARGKADATEATEAGDAE